ncbi:hypothetical protein YC2023_071586 [Brassica napus]
MGGRRFVTPRQTCPRPERLGRNLRSKTRWFTGFCNSHQVSHFATFFIDARAEISVAESRFRLYIAALLPNKHRLRLCVRSNQTEVLAKDERITTESAGTVRNRPTESDVSSFSGRSVSRWTSRDVAYGEPPMSPRSEHFTGSFNRGVLKATSADPWSASFMVETRTLFVFHKSKNFTSNYEIRMPPTACVEHSNFFKVTAPEARPGQLRPGAYRRQKRQADRTHTDVRVCPSAHTGRPWPSVSTHRTSGCPSVHISARSVDCSGDFGPRGLSVQYTQDVRQHTQDVRGCPCVSVCPSVHTGRSSAHTGRPSAHAGRPSAHAGHPWLSVCPSAHAGRPSVHTGRPSAHKGRPWLSVSTHRTSVAVRQHTQDVRQYTEDVRGRPSAHTGRPSAHAGRPWLSVCVRVSVSTHRTSVSTHRTSVSTHRTSVAVRQYTQDVRGRPSVHISACWPFLWTVRVILAHVGCLFSTHRTSVSTRRTSVPVR